MDQDDSSGKTFSKNELRRTKRRIVLLKRVKELAINDNKIILVVSGKGQYQDNCLKIANLTTELYHLEKKVFHLKGVLSD